MLATLSRPTYAKYELPSQERKSEAPHQAAPVVTLVSDRIAPFQKLSLARFVYRVSNSEHVVLKRALLSSVRVRARLGRG